MDPSYSEPPTPSTPNPGINIRMSSHEMLSQVLDWNLGCDTAVLNRLKDYSENMLRRAGTIKEECNSYVQEVDMLQTRVQNVTNQFLHLSNDQFVENCVEEFEERDISKQASASPLVHQVKTKAEKEAELIKKMKESIQLGIKSNSFCDQLRSVPKVKTAHIIGTSKFFGSRFCGLLEEDRLRPASHPNTVITTETPSDDLNSHQTQGLTESILIPKAPSSTDSEYLFQTRESAQSQLSKRESSLSSEDNFLGTNRTPFTSSSNSVGTNNSHDTDLRKPEDYPPARAPISIIDDLNKVLKARVPPPPAADTDSEEDFKPRSGAGRDLFADDDEDIFSSAARSGYTNQAPSNDGTLRNPSPVANTIPNHSTKNQINSIADLIKAQPKLPEQKKTSTVKQSVFLESDSDGDGDLFSSSSSAHSSAKPPKTQNTNHNLFNHNQDSQELLKPQLHPSAEQKTSAPKLYDLESATKFQNKNSSSKVPPLKQKQQKSIFDESDSDDDMFSFSSSKRRGGTSTTSTDTEQPSVKSLSTHKSPSSSGLFESQVHEKSSITGPTAHTLPASSGLFQSHVQAKSYTIEQAAVVPISRTSTSASSDLTPLEEKDADAAQSEAVTLKLPELPATQDPTEAEKPASRKVISQKLENIFKKSGPPLPGFPPKHYPPNLKLDVSSEGEVEVIPTAPIPEDNVPRKAISPTEDDAQTQLASVLVSSSTAKDIKAEAVASPTSDNKELLHPDASAGDSIPTRATAETANKPLRQISQSSLFHSSDDDGLSQSFSSSGMENKSDYELPATFDNPPSSNLLICLAKNRVKITHKRRRPTNKSMPKSSLEVDSAGESFEPANYEIEKITPTDETAIPSIVQQEDTIKSSHNETSQSSENDIPAITATAGDQESIAPPVSNSSNSSPLLNSPPADVIRTKPTSVSAAGDDIFAHRDAPKVVETSSSSRIVDSTIAGASEAYKEKELTPGPSNMFTKTSSKEQLASKSSTQQKKPVKQSIFDDSDSDSDIFSSAKQKPATTTPSAKVVNGLPSPAAADPIPPSSGPARPTQGKTLQKSSNTKQRSIFAESDSDSGDDIFAPKSKTLQKATGKTVSLFPTDDGSPENSHPSVLQQSGLGNAEDLSSAVEKSNTKPEPPKSKRSTNIKQKSIFDDSDSDSDIFSSKSSKTKFT